MVFLTASLSSSLSSSLVLPDGAAAAGVLAPVAVDGMDALLVLRTIDGGDGALVSPLLLLAAAAVVVVGPVLAVDNMAPVDGDGVGMGGIGPRRIFSDWKYRIFTL